MGFDYKGRYLSWIKFDPSASKLSKSEIKTSFSSDLEFGTAGLRAIMGSGTNRLNIYTVKKATLALCEHLKETFVSDIKVAISYDTRHNSKKFAKEAARTLIQNGIDVYLSKNAEPTPFLSYCVRHYRCSAGIMITASHNPSSYNGYKCYDETGCQIREDVASRISEKMRSIVFPLRDVILENAADIKYVDEDCKNSYIEKVISNLTKQTAENLSVVFTPLNGCSCELVSHMAKKLCIENFFVVEEQEAFDPNFTTCKNPNPELLEAFDLAIKLSLKTNPDIILAVDPDGDRIGVCVKNKNKYVKLCGNQVAILLLDYLLKTEKGLEGKFIVKSIVSTPMISAIARDNNLEVIEVLTGFKYIGEKAEVLGEKFLFGFEESCGYLLGDYARDKDAVLAFGLICQAAAFYKNLNKTFFEQIDELYKKYGYYKEQTLALSFSDEQKQSIIKKIRKEWTSKIEDYKIIKRRDFLVDSGNLPKSDVLIFELEDCKVVIRPSGTEAKIKIYLFSKGKTKMESEENIETLKQVITKLLSESVAL